MSTVKQRRLAAELRRLRSEAEMTREDVTDRIELNAATLYRLETGQSRPQRRTLTALLDLYEVVEPQRAHLVDLAKVSTDQSWFQAYVDDIPEEYSTYIQLEDEALSVRNYETILVPGILQTPAYIRAATMGMTPSAEPELVELQVKIRTARQQVLERKRPLKVWAIVDEAVLHRQVGGAEVMREQLQHLAEMAARPTVTLQVVPFSAGAHPGMAGGFSVLSFETPEPDVAYTWGTAGELFLEGPGDVARHGAMYDHLRASALSSADSAQLLTATVGGTGR